MLQSNCGQTIQQDVGKLQKEYGEKAKWRIVPDGPQKIAV